MATYHTISYADKVYAGKAYNPRYQAAVQAVVGNGFTSDAVEWMPIRAVQLGQVATAATNAIYSGTSTATGTSNSLTITGSTVTNSVATFAAARAVFITCTGDNSGLTFNFSGTDLYGYQMTAALVGPTGTGGTTTLKAFLTVSGCTITASTSGLVQIGTSNTLGFPFRVANAGEIQCVSVDGVPVSLTVVAAVATTVVSSATTGDVRGTFISGTAPNGTRYISTYQILTVQGSATMVFGVAQA